MPQTEKIQIPIEVLDKASKNLNTINKELADTGKSTDKMSSGMGKASMSLTDLNSAVSLVRQGLQALKQIYDFGKEGAAIQRMGEASGEVFRQMGSDIDSAVSTIRAASLNTISDYDAMAAASRAAMLGVSADAEQLGQLMQIAAFRGRAMGVDTTTAFNDIVTGIGRASPLILDNLGIVTKGWADEAAAAGGAYDAQFILNKVLEQGGEQLAKAGGLAADNATSFERFEAGIKNLGNRAKEETSEGIEPLVSWLGDLLEATYDYQLQLDDLDGYQEKAKEQLRETGELTGAAAPKINALALQMQRQAKEAAMADQSLLKYNYTVEETTEVVEVSAEALKQMTDYNREWLDTLGTATKEQDTYNDKMADLKKELDEVSLRYGVNSEKAQELRDKMNEYTEEYELNSKRRILAGIEERLAADELTEAETKRLEDLGLAWGIYTEDAILQARAEREEIELLSGAIMRIPTEWTTEIRINTIGSVPQFAGMEQEFRVESGRGYASGTRGWETVPSGFPNDSYKIGLTSGEKFAVVPPGQTNSQTQSGMSRDDLDYLIRGFKSALQQVM